MLRRLPLRFGLRGLLVVTTCVCLWLGYNVRLVQERREAYREATGNENWSRLLAYESGGNRKISWLRRALGDHYVEGFVYRSETEAAQVNRLQRLFPEARLVTFKQDTFVQAESRLERVYRSDVLSPKP